MTTGKTGAFARASALPEPGAIPTVDERLQKVLDDAVAEVASWPEWKRQAIRERKEYEECIKQLEPEDPFKYGWSVHQ